ncbi:Protein T28F4.4 [Aphelenchoides avenae]|nr:Protein T28F4.4 [Aphelenchus avenae]
MKVFRSCSTVLLELLLLPPADEASLEATRIRWRNFVLKLSKHSHELREQFGQDAIYRVLERDSLPIYLCDFLCYFSLEAWSRSVLRESGALKKILERFATSEDAAERATIITGLKNFEHDNQTMSYLCQSSEFLDVALRMLRDYAEERKVACTVEFANPDEEALLYRADSPFAQELEQRLQAEADSTEGQEEQLHKTFFGSESPPAAGPSSSPVHNIWSPSVSPTSAQSPALSPSSSYGSLLSDFFGVDDDSNGAISPARDSEQAGADGAMQDGRRSRQLSTTEEENEISERRQELMINDLSHIISWQTHQDEGNFVNLIKASVLQTLVDFISDAPTFNERMARSVMRLTRSRRLLEDLLDMNFHMMVLHRLVRRDCILARGAKFCSRCDKRRHFGRDVLREFIDHVDSIYGISFLHLRLESAEDRVKENALIAGVVLLRNQARKQRFYHNYMPLETLLSKMHGILMTHSDSEETPEFSTEEEGFFVNVVASFSTLLSRRSLMGLVELSDSSGSAPSTEKPATECRVTSLKPDAAALEFMNKAGQVIVAVPKEEVLASSAYYRGMFENEFIERVEGRQTFMFDDAVEMCGQSDFIRFLHYLSGCRGECTKITSVETCVALLHLSDKYICSELQSELLRPQGPVRRMVRGDTLRFFLPLVLTVPLLRTELSNLCALVLLRYSNREELVSTLKEMAKQPIGIDALLELLKDFLTASCNNDRFAPSDAARFLDF